MIFIKLSGTLKNGKKICYLVNPTKIKLVSRLEGAEHTSVYFDDQEELLTVDNSLEDILERIEYCNNEPLWED